MENDLFIRFKEEEREVAINILQPDLAQLVHAIISEHLKVSRENIEIDTENSEFDKEEFLEILISVHEEFSQEIDKFYDNIRKEIRTYYSDEELENIIIDKIKNDQLEEIIEN